VASPRERTGSRKRRYLVLQSGEFSQGAPAVRPIDFAPSPAEDRRQFCELETIKLSLDNPMTFPWNRERVAGQKLTLLGWYFDLADGHLLRLDPANRKFERVEG